MWDPENFPGAENVPWQLLIRARYVHEIDAVLASTVVAQVGAVASTEITRRVALAAHEAVAQAHGVQAKAEQRVAALDAALDWDNWCGTPPRPFHWPPRHGHDFDDLSDPAAGLVFEKALELVRAGGSEVLQRTLGSALSAAGSLRGEMAFAD